MIDFIRRLLRREAASAKAAPAMAQTSAPRAVAPNPYPRAIEVRIDGNRWFRQSTADFFARLRELNSRQSNGGKVFGFERELINSFFDDLTIAMQGGDHRVRAVA